MVSLNSPHTHDEHSKNILPAFPVRTLLYCTPCVMMVVMMMMVMVMAMGKGLVRITHGDLQRRQLQAEVSGREERVGRSLRSHERRGGHSRTRAIPF